MPDLITQIATGTVLDKAYHWLCKRRIKLSHNNDVWALRRKWDRIKPDLQHTFLRGECRFSPQVELRLPEENLECWSALDSLVLKAMALVLGHHLASSLSPHCVHIKGHGGAKKAVKEAYLSLSPGSHVMKSDVQSYYASIDHKLLIDMLAEYITGRYVLRLLWQYLKRTVCYGENYRDITKGISLGCPLSPLIAALFLKPLDDAMQATGFFYRRFIDDWIVIAPTRWKLRNAVKKVNVLLAALLLEKHPDKTFIGKAERSFDFLGYHFGPHGLTVAKDTLDRFVKRATRLYEQEREKPYGSSRLGQYVKRWFEWLTSGNLFVNEKPHLELKILSVVLYVRSYSNLLRWWCLFVFEYFTSAVPLSIFIFDVSFYCSMQYNRA